jgi:hypothetical protein
VGSGPAAVVGALVAEAAQPGRVGAHGGVVPVASR